MTLPELQNQALQLSLADRRILVQSLLRSIQEENPSPNTVTENSVSTLHPWTQSLLGVIKLNTEEDSIESYVDYLEEKYS